MIEYHHCSEEQVHPYAVQIFFYDEKKRRAIIDGYLHDYLDYFSDKEEPESGEEDLDSGQLLAGTALEAFRNCFADRPEFSSGAKGRDFLGKVDSSNESQVAERLHEWTAQLLLQYQAQDGFIKMVASTSQDLAKMIEPFVASWRADDDKEHEPSPWPLVQVVQ